MGVRGQALAESGGTVPRRVPLLVAVFFGALLVPAGWTAVVDTAPGSRWLAAVIGAAYLIGCVGAYPLVGHASATLRRVSYAGLLILGAVFVALTGLEHSAILLCALGILPVLAAPVEAVGVLVVVVTAGAVAASQQGVLVEQVPNLLILVSVGIAALLMVRLAEANEELARARDRIAVLAVVEERQRFARDLHDVLGHSLTAITVKAALARRVLQTGDVDRSLEEVRDVERLGRTALADVRDTVAEYRETSLATELTAATEVLRAAGVTADLPCSAEGVDAGMQEVFGYVLREAVTNVVRHADARRVTVHTGQYWITVADDGRGGTVTGGHGLRSLHERMRGVGGSVEAGPGEGGGFVVRARGPVPGEEMP